MSEKKEIVGRAKGGIARKEALSPARRKEIAQRAAASRWNKRATHDGTLTLGDVSIPCAVLEDGTRVLSQRGVNFALGRVRGGTDYRDGGDKLPTFLAPSNLLPFIDNDLVEEISNPIEYLPMHGGRSAFGIEATSLPKICAVWLRARREGALSRPQLRIADKAEMLVRALAQVGIVALVDEATGYQELRDKKALQALLDKYLRKELAAWAKRFPDDFYKEMFRLRGWRWPVPSARRPGAVGNYTTDLVYERLAPGIVAELEARNPKDERGNRRGRHHQLLTDDVGHPALAQHLHAVIGLMRASSGWDQFYRMMNRAFPKKGQTLELALDD
jgi:P63C domain